MADKQPLAEDPSPDFEYLSPQQEAELKNTRVTLDNDLRGCLDELSRLTLGNLTQKYPTVNNRRGDSTILLSRIQWLTRRMSIIDKRLALASKEMPVKINTYIEAAKKSDSDGSVILKPFKSGAKVKVDNGAKPELADEPTELSKVCVFAVRGESQLLLCTQRQDPPFKRQWELPGGHVDPGETPEIAAKRELVEETHLDLDKIGASLTFIGLYETLSFSPEKKRLNPIHINLFAVLLNELPDVQKGEDVDDVQWLPSPYRGLAYHYDALVNDARLWREGAVKDDKKVVEVKAAE